MMPPECCLCDLPGGTDNEFNLVYFASTPEVKQWQHKMEESGLTGHPPNAAWFCQFHFPAADQLSSLPIDQAMTELKQDGSWTIYYLDFFDRETPPLPHESGFGLAQGLALLWRNSMDCTRGGTEKYPLNGYHLEWSNRRRITIPPINDDLLRLGQLVHQVEDPLPLCMRLGHLHADSIRRRKDDQFDCHSECDKLLELCGKEETVASLIERLDSLIRDIERDWPT